VRSFPLKTPTAYVVVLLSLAVLLVFPTMKTVSAMGPNTYVGLYWPLANNYNFDIDLKVTEAPEANTGLFWAHQFQFVGGSGGYMGLQIVGSEMRAIFSIWGAITANPNTGQSNGCRELEEYGKVWSCGAKYDWKIGVNYRLRLWVTNKDSSGNQWWVGAINDYSTNSETIIGTILAPASFGLLSTWSTTWVEYFAYTTCDAPHTRAIFSYPYARNAGGDHAPQKAMVDYGTSGCNNTNVSYLGDGAYVLEAGQGVQRATPDQTPLWSQEPALVRQPPTSGTPGSPPSISAYPTLVRQGQSINVTGSGFTPNGPVTLIVKPYSSQATADGSGNLYATFYVGTDIPTGNYEVMAHDVNADTDSNGVMIKVVPAASTTTSSSTSNIPAAFNIDPSTAAAIIVVTAVILGSIAGYRRLRPGVENAEVTTPLGAGKKFDAAAKTKPCGSCGAELPSDAKFCDSCGSRQ